MSDKASSSERLDRLKIVRERAMSLTLQACYRDDTSRSLIQTTLRQQKAIKAHEDNKDYQRPPLIYTLPDPTRCENPIVASDTRTNDEKKNDINQKLFEKKFGKDVEPTSYFVSFKVVGVSPASTSSGDPMNSQSNDQIRSLNDVVLNLLKTSGIGQVIPLTLYDKLPDKTKYADIFTYTPSYFFGNQDNKTRYIEFANAHDAQKFIDEQSCTTQYDNTYKPIGRPYQASLSFSNSAALNDIRTKASQWFNYATIGVIVLAAAMRWITIGRTIADGRHETAIFRAIGFKRLDIAIVYALYMAILSILIAVFAAGIGFLSAHIINQNIAPGLTVQAQYAFGGIDLSKEVSLISINHQQLSLLLIACLATGILSMIIPLLRNIRRSPIHDMREE